VSQWKMYVYLYYYKTPVASFVTLGLSNMQ